MLCFLPLSSFDGTGPIQGPVIRFSRFHLDLDLAVRLTAQIFPAPSLQPSPPHPCSHSYAIIILSCTWSLRDPSSIPEASPQPKYQVPCTHRFAASLVMVVNQAGLDLQEGRSIGKALLTMFYQQLHSRK